MSLAQMLGVPSNSYYTANGNIYVAGATGLITGYTPAGGTLQQGILPNDVIDLLEAGARYTFADSKWVGPITPLAASAAVNVASAALSNGAFAVAAQPDVPRPLALVVIPGAAAITAGAIAMTYVSTTGQTVTDTFTCVTGSGVSLTQNSSHGVAHISGIGCSGLVGGASPTRELGATASISLPVPPTAASISVFKENTDNVDGTVGTVTTAIASNGDMVCSVAPTTAPNGTHVYSYGVSFFG